MIERAKQTRDTLLNFKKWLGERERAAVQEQTAEIVSGSTLERFRGVSNVQGMDGADVNHGRGRDRDMRELLANVNLQGHVPYLLYRTRTRTPRPSPDLCAAVIIMTDAQRADE